MATRFMTRFQLTKQTLTSIFSPSITPPRHFLSTSSLFRLRPISAVSGAGRFSPPRIGIRSFATRQTSSSLNDQNPNWSNRPPKETILLDGCDFEHWLVVMEKPEGEPTRDEIIDSYIKTLATVVGSEDEARMKIYSVSTRCYFAFGALVSEELSYKIKELPRVRWVLPDSYLDVRNKDYGGEPFIDGKAVPYDPKYHEEWIRNNSKANERNRRNDRPRNNDRSRNFDRRRENMQNRDFQNREMPPMPNQTMQNVSNMGGGGGMPPMGGGGMPPPPPPMGGMPPPPPNSMGGPMPPPPHNMGGGPMPPPPHNMGGGPMPPPHHNMGGGPPRNMGGMPPGPNPGWSNTTPNFQNQAGPYPNGPNSGPGMTYQQSPNNGPPMSYQNGPNNGPGMGYQGSGGPGPMPNREYQNNYPPNRDVDGGNTYQTRDLPGRDMPHPNRDMDGGNTYQTRDLPGRDMPPPPPPNYR